MRLFRRPDGRYYAIFPPTHDLFGDPVIITYHGSSDSHLGGVKTYYTTDDVARLERTLVLTRLRHGYTETPT